MMYALMLPILAGIAVATLNRPSINTYINNISHAVNSHLNYLRIKNDILSKYLFRPLIGLFYGVSRSGESISPKNVRAGLRLTVLSYCMEVCLLILYILLSFIVVIFTWLLILVFVLFVISVFIRKSK